MKALNQSIESHHSPTPDVRIINGSSVFLFVLLTDRAREWVDEWVSEDRMMFGRGLAVEHRYAAALAAAMQSDGLRFDVQGGL